jgi:hypothetical protein
MMMSSGLTLDPYSNLDLKSKVVKKKSKYPEPKPGETIHCWMGGEEYIAHHHMLYLGKDKNNEDKILVKNKRTGWKIISLSELPEGCHRPLGRWNLTEEVYNKKKKIFTKFTYQFYDGGKTVDITAKLYRGLWILSGEFKIPSWVKE